MTTSISPQFPLDLFVGDHTPSMLKKPIEAIQVAIVGGYHNRTQRLAFNLFLQHAHKAGMDIDQYQMPKTELVQLMEYNSRNIAHLKKTLVAMQELRMEWDVMANAEGRAKTAERWASIVMVRYVSFDANSVYFQFDSAVKPYLFDPDTYANLDLNIQKRLTLDTAFVLYEWVVRYRNVHRTRAMPWEQWRTVLYADPEHSDVMQEYKEFKRRKLLPAIRELNELSDLIIELVEIKGGTRAVRDLQFLIVEKPRFIANQEEGSRRDEIENKIKVFGLSRTERKNIFERYSLNDIEATCNYVLQRLNSPDQSKPIKDAARYFKTSLLKGYAKKQVVPAQNTLVTELAPVHGGETAGKAIQQKFHEERTTQAWQMFSEMDEADCTALITKYNAACAASLRVPKDAATRSNRIMIPFYAWLARDTWGDPSLEDAFAFASKFTEKGR